MNVADLAALIVPPKVCSSLELPPDEVEPEPVVGAPVVEVVLDEEDELPQLASSAPTARTGITSARRTRTCRIASVAMVVHLRSWARFRLVPLFEFDSRYLFTVRLGPLAPTGPVLSWSGLARARR